MTEAETRKWIDGAYSEFAIDAVIGDDDGGEGRISIAMAEIPAATIRIAYSVDDGAYQDVSVLLPNSAIRALHEFLGIFISQMAPD